MRFFFCWVTMIWLKASVDEVNEFDEVHDTGEVTDTRSHSEVYEVEFVQSVVW